MARSAVPLRQSIWLQGAESFHPKNCPPFQWAELASGKYNREYGVHSYLISLFFFLRNLTGTFPEYPNVEEGGSAIIFSNKTPQQVQRCLRKKTQIHCNPISLNCNLNGFIVLLGLGYFPANIYMEISQCFINCGLLNVFQNEITLPTVFPLKETWQHTGLTFLVSSEQLDFKGPLCSGPCLPPGVICGSLIPIVLPWAPVVHWPILPVPCVTAPSVPFCTSCSLLIPDWPSSLCPPLHSCSLVKSQLFTIFMLF